MRGESSKQKYSMSGKDTQILAPWRAFHPDSFIQSQTLLQTFLFCLIQSMAEGEGAVPFNALTKVLQCFAVPKQRTAFAAQAPFLVCTILSKASPVRESNASNLAAGKEASMYSAMSLRKLKL